MPAATTPWASGICAGANWRRQKCFQTAIERLTRRNANPYDGEAVLQSGLCLCLMPDAGGSPEDAARLLAEAGDALHKAAWNQAWQSAACHALAELACRRRDWTGALEHLDRSLRANAIIRGRGNCAPLCLTR